MNDLTLVRFMGPRWLVFAMAILWVCVPQAAFADGVPCSGRDFVGGYETQGSAIGIELVDDTAYVLDRDHGLYIFDVSTPSSPALLGRYSDPDSIDRYQSMVADGTRVYLVVSPHGSSKRLLVLDASNPANVSLSGTLHAEEVSLDFEVRDNVIYFRGAYALTTYDLADPTAPQMLGVYESFNFATFFAIQGDRAYLADSCHSELRMRVLDLSDPTFANPKDTEIGSFEIHILPDHLEVVGDIAYVGHRIAGLHIYDIADLEQAVILGTYDPLGFPSHFQVVDDLVYLSSYRLGLEAVDVSDPSNPVLVGTSMTPGLTSASVVRDDRVFFSSYDKGFQVIDITNLSTPLLGSHQIAENGEYSSPVKLALQEDVLYVATYITGLQIIDVSDASSPIAIGSYRENDNVTEVQVEGDLAYIALNTRDGELSGVHILDVSNPASPQTVGFYAMETIYEMGVRDGIVYVISHDQRLHLIDATTPADPILRSALVAGQSCESISLSGDTLYLADQVPGGGLVAVDISDLNSPRILSRFDDMPGAWVNSLVADGDTVYVTTNETMDHDPYAGTGHPGGVHAVDCSDPSHPVLISSFETVVYTRQPRVSGNMLALASAGQAWGATFLDISDPTAMRNLGALYPGVGGTDLAAHGDRAYAATSDGPGSIRILDISDDCALCPADFNGDGSLNFFDVRGFIIAYLDADTDADMNGDGAFNFFDLNTYLWAFIAGCP